MRTADKVCHACVAQKCCFCVQLVVRKCRMSAFLSFGDVPEC